MNSNNPIRNYKHDISGKFKDINSAIASLDECAFNSLENNEIFHAVHEVLLKMVKTSRSTMFENLKQEIVLVVSGKTPSAALSKLQIEGMTVRYESSQEKMIYYYFKKENTGDVSADLLKISSFLPVKTVLNETEEG